MNPSERGKYKFGATDQSSIHFKEIPLWVIEKIETNDRSVNSRRKVKIRQESQCKLSNERRYILDSILAIRLIRVEYDEFSKILCCSHTYLREVTVSCEFEQRAHPIRKILYLMRYSGATKRPTFPGVARLSLLVVPYNAPRHPELSFSDATPLCVCGCCSSVGKQVHSKQASNDQTVEKRIENEGMREGE